MNKEPNMECYKAGDGDTEIVFKFVGEITAMAQAKLLPMNGNSFKNIALFQAALLLYVGVLTGTSIAASGQPFTGKHRKEMDKMLKNNFNEGMKLYFENARRLGGDNAQS